MMVPEKQGEQDAVTSARFIPDQTLASSCPELRGHCPVPARVLAEQNPALLPSMPP